MSGARLYAKDPLTLLNQTFWNNPLWLHLERGLAGLEAWRLKGCRPGEPDHGEPDRASPVRGDSNVDRRELSKFEATAPEWWDPKGPSGALHAINPLRLNFILDCGNVHQRQVLDVGCGGGLLCEALVRAGARVTGIDQGQSALSVARAHARQQGLSIEYQTATAEAWAHSHPQHYDLVVCMELLEHVPDPASVVAACAALAKPGGRVVFATLNRNAKSYLFAIFGAEYVLGLLPPRTHDWRRFIAPEALIRHAAAARLQPIAARGLTYNPFYRVYRLGRDMSVNYMLAFGKPESATPSP
jgi:2-polyprenyl-6-hydroxyphenyl methylase/3-demethylubiquinone-9 3-methyltransferase